MTREEVIELLKDHDLLMKGNRNNDAVNLAIVAYSDREGRVAGSNDLLMKIEHIIESEKLESTDKSDIEYLRMKCKDLIRYLPKWYDTGDIYQYAII